LKENSQALVLIWVSFFVCAAALYRFFDNLVCFWFRILFYLEQWMFGPWAWFLLKKKSKTKIKKQKQNKQTNFLLSSCFELYFRNLQSSLLEFWKSNLCFVIFENMWLFWNFGRLFENWILEFELWNWENISVCLINFVRFFSGATGCGKGIASCLKCFSLLAWKLPLKKKYLLLVNNCSSYVLSSLVFILIALLFACICI